MFRLRINSIFTKFAEFKPKILVIKLSKSIIPRSSPYPSFVGRSTMWDNSASYSLSWLRFGLTLETSHNPTPIRFKKSLLFKTQRSSLSMTVFFTWSLLWDLLICKIFSCWLQRYQNHIDIIADGQWLKLIEVALCCVTVTGYLHLMGFNFSVI